MLSRLTTCSLLRSSPSSNVLLLPSPFSTPPFSSLLFYFCFLGHLLSRIYIFLPSKHNRHRSSSPALPLSCLALERAQPLPRAMLRWTRLANKDAAPASPNGTLHVGSDGLTEDERLALEELDRFYGMENVSRPTRSPRRLARSTTSSRLASFSTSDTSCPCRYTYSSTITYACRRRVVDVSPMLGTRRQACGVCRSPLSPPLCRPPLRRTCAIGL